MSEKVWFITGTSRGFGREWAIAALERGDKVAATARDTATLDDLAEKYGDALLPIQLDVTDRDADFAAVKQAHDHFGRLDIVVNNAGYGHFGFIEELTEAEARATRSRRTCSARCGSPRPRCRTCGRSAAATSSRCRRSAASPRSRTSASTTRRSGRSRASRQALAQEVAPFGIHVTLIEPGGFSTDWAGSSSKRSDAAARLQRGARGGRPASAAQRDVQAAATRRRRRRAS